MSPITHALTGWLIAQPLQTRRDRTLVTVAAIISDIDGLALVAGVEAYQTYHHTIGHNVLFGLLVGLACFSLSGDKFMAGILGLGAFHVHLVEDLLGSGTDWGIPFFWPLSDHMTFSFPPFQWELSSWQNLLATCFCLIGTGWVGIKRGRTIVELFSVNADQKIVAVLRHRFSRIE